MSASANLPQSGAGNDGAKHNTMEKFEFHYPVKQYFGKGCAEDAVKKEMKNTGANVLLAYGGGSLKRTGLYDRIRSWLEE